jgi:16S rRNA (uracil1498-N3)-methyltransferase
MQRYFASVKGEEVILSLSDEHHLLDVMRAKAGEKIEIVDGGIVYSATVRSVDPLRIEKGEEVRQEHELPCHLLLAFALLKGGHDEWVLQKGTELGVAAFYPFLSKRTIIEVRDDKDKAKRFDRYSKIVKGAAEQCKRSTLPEVSPVLSFDELLEIPADLHLVAYENVSEDGEPFGKAVAALKAGQSCLLLIGPEGGFEPSEIEKARQAGFQTVGLGKRILRAETASVYAASVFSFVSEGLQS